MTLVRSFLALALAAALGHPAWAARPLDTDDACVIDAGACELEASRTVARAGSDRVGETAGVLSCGVALRTQLGLEYDQARATATANPQDGRSRALALTAKTALWTGEGARAAGLALSGAWRWSRSGQTGWQRDAGEVRLIGSLPLAAADIHVNLGHLRSHTGGADSTVWGVAVEHPPLKLLGWGWAPLAEIFGDDRGERWTQVGLRATVLADVLFVDLAYARQPTADKARAWQAGLRWAF